MASNRVERTRKGSPAVWEEGGGMTNTGSCTVWCGSTGEPLHPIFRGLKGHLSNGRHALFILRKGMLRVNATYYSGQASINVSSIVSIEGDTYTTAPVWEWDGCSDEDVPEYIRDVVAAALEKVRCYHCRESHYSISHLPE